MGIQVDLRGEIGHGDVYLINVHSGIQEDIRLRNGRVHISGGGGGGVDGRVWVALDGEGVTSVSRASGRLRADEGRDEEEEGEDAVRNGENHGDVAVRQLGNDVLERKEGVVVHDNNLHMKLRRALILPLE